MSGGADPRMHAAELAAVVRDPVRFCRTVLREDLWPVQEDILRALAKPRARVAVKACHSSGKTRVAADAALWFLTAFTDGIVITTAPTWHQVTNLLWGEIRGAVARARIKYPIPNQSELRLGEKNYALGLSTNEGVRFQGHHSGHVLVILDEAPGVRGDIYEAIEGIRAGGDVRELALGNPTIVSGPFYDAFTTKRELWNPFTISVTDTPNLRGIDLEDLKTWAKDDPRLHDNVRPYLTTRSWTWEAWHEWGRFGHPLWDARVLGQFPVQAEDALIALSWVERAKLRPVEDGGGPIIVGIDVAGPGEDETVMIVREAGNVLLEQAWAAADPRGAVVAALTPFRARLKVVNVDSAGIGYNFGLHLRDQGFPVELINVGQSPRDGERYRNHKAEAYWGLRMRFAAGDIAIGSNTLGRERLTTQLTGIRYKLNPRGQVEIETKDDARKRGVKSPDRAEALMLAFAQSTSPGMGMLDFFTSEADRMQSTGVVHG